MSLYKDPHSPHWYVSICVAGKRLRQSTGTSDKREAQRIHDQLKAGLWERKKNGETWVDACILWLNAEDRNESDRYRVRALPIPNKPLNELTSSDIEQCLSPVASTYNREANLVSAILHLAKRKGYLEEIPNIERKEVKESRVRWLTKAEWEKLYAQLPEHLKPIAKFSIATGLRQHNATHLEWSQVDMRRKVAWIHPDQAKAGKAIGIPLSNDAMDVLRGQIGKHDRWVFPYTRKRLGDEITAPMEQIKGAWSKALQRAGLGEWVGEDEDRKFTPNFRWHDLRHTWATWHIMNGTPLEVLQKLGGWSSYSMVLKYAHLSSDYLKGYADNAKPYSWEYETRICSEGEKN